MLYNHFKVALRFLSRHRAYTSVNIFGLAIGITCCLLILLFIRDEFSYDQFHERADQSFKVLRQFEREDGSSFPILSPPVATAIAQEYPEVRHVTRLFRHWTVPLIARGEHVFMEDEFLFTDSTFFSVFSFPLLRGDASTVLTEPYSVVLTESSARKYFGSEDPIGQTIQYNTRDEFTVTGIMQDPPHNTHVHPDFLASMTTLPRMLWPTILDGWTFNSFHTYVVLEDGVSPASLESKIRDLIVRNTEDEGQATLYLQPLADIHLHSQLSYQLEANSDIRYIYFLSIFGLLILFMACINYMNLAVAQSAKRAREVGMRKVVGAQRGQLVQQFFSESFLLSLIAFIVAVALTSLLLPVVNDLSGKQLVLHLTDGWIVAGLLGIITITGVLAGSYPALVLSRFQPATVLKGKWFGGVERAFFRKGLVTFQFAATVVLLVATFVIFKQVDYVRTTKIGFNKEQVLVLPIQDPEIRQHYDAFRRSLLRQSDVVSVGAGSAFPGSTMPTTNFQWESQAEDELLAGAVAWIDPGYLATLEIEVGAGQIPSPAFGVDTSAVLLNEAAVQAMGWATPEDALGKVVSTSMDERSDLRVLGVVKDYHFESLHHRIEPLVLYPSLTQPRYVVVRIRPEDIAGALASVKATWEQFASSQPFLYSFLDEDFDQSYRAEEQWGKVISYAALIALLIGCLGLFSLAAFTAEQRTKEIGIRKVLGANVVSIAYLIAIDFFKLVVLGFMLAIPIAYIAMNRWLENFAYRIDIGLSVFLTAGALTCLIVLLTVSYQAIKAALANPVKSLRQE